MILTLGQASKATGKQKSTISNAIDKGRISAKKNDLGHWQIDLVELFRVYPKISSDSTKMSKTEHGDTTIELIKLRQENQSLERALQKAEEQCEKWEKQAEKITLLLSNKTSIQPSQKKKGFFKLLFG